MTKRALLSVSDKQGLTDFAKGLVALDYELISTGGTKKALEAADIPVSYTHLTLPTICSV